MNGFDNGNYFIQKLKQGIRGTFKLTPGAQCFATVSGLNDMFPGNGVEICFSCLVGVSKLKYQPISSKVYINHAVLKRPLAQWVQVKSFNMCLLQLGIHNN